MPFILVIPLFFFIFLSLSPANAIPVEKSKESPILTEQIEKILKIPVKIGETIDVDGFHGLLLQSPSTSMLAILFPHHLFLGDVYRLDGTNITAEAANARNARSVLQIFSNALENRALKNHLATDKNGLVISDELFHELSENLTGEILNPSAKTPPRLLVLGSENCPSCRELERTLQKRNLPFQVKTIPVSLNERDEADFQKWIAQKSPEEQKSLRQKRDRANSFFALLAKEKKAPCCILKDGQKNRVLSPALLLSLVDTMRQ